MTDLILRTAALVSLFCGLISGTFVTIVYVTIRRLEGNLERRHVLVLTSVSSRACDEATLATIPVFINTKDIVHMPGGTITA